MYRNGGVDQSIKGIVQTVMFRLCFGVLKPSNACYYKLVCFYV